jgi:hypothetical protein
MVFTLIQIAKKLNLQYQPFFGVKFRKKFVTNSMIYFLNHQKLKHVCLNLEKNTIFIYVAHIFGYHVFHVKNYCKVLLTKYKNYCYKINQGLKCGEICTMVVMGKRKNLLLLMLLLLFGA